MYALAARVDELTGTLIDSLRQAVSISSLVGPSHAVGGPARSGRQQGLSETHKGAEGDEIEGGHRNNKGGGEGGKEREKSEREKSEREKSEREKSEREKSEREKSEREKSEREHARKIQKKPEKAGEKRKRNRKRKD